MQRADEPRLDSRTEAPPSDAVRPAESDVDVDTAVLTLSPEFLSQLRSIAPRSRRSLIPHVLAMAIIAFAVAVGGNRQMREYLTERWLTHPLVAQIVSKARALR